MSPRGERARLFYALDIPDGLRESIGEWQRGVADPALRPVAAEALHVTLAFLGSRPVAEIERLGETVVSLPAEPVVGRLEPEPVALPRRRPRLWALGVESLDAGRLQAALIERLRTLDLPGLELEERPFWPHLTVLRLRGARRTGARKAAPRELSHPLPAGDGHAFGFVRVALYRSEPRPEGSTYSRLAAIELPRSGGPQKR
jgi:2'-5' RNA ligase